MNLPDGFADEYWQMRERYDWAANLGSSIDVHQAKLAVEDTRAFLDRWLGKIGDPEIEAGLEAFSAAVTRIARALDQKFLEALRAVVEARKDWVVAELIFKAMRDVIKIRELCPPQLKAG